MTGAVLSRDMTPDEFKAWYARLKAIDPTLTDTKLAKALDVDQPRIGKWRRGDVGISGYLQLALERLEQIMIEERQPKPAPKKRTGRRRPPDHGGAVCEDCGLRHAPGDTSRCIEGHGDDPPTTRAAAAEQRDRLIQAVTMLGGLERFAQCPVCQADRTNGEWHDDDCPMVAVATRAAAAEGER